jgi:hypothetical protein
LLTLDTLPDEEHESHKVSLVQSTQTAVEEAILGLDKQKGLGPVGISPSILRKLVSIVKIPLTLLFNLSLATGIFLQFGNNSVMQHGLMKGCSMFHCHQLGRVF